MAVSVGSRLGPYELVAPLGAGGMGEVWRARDTRLAREVAVKVLPAGFANSAPLRARFEREAKAISSLNHPHICTLHDVGSEDGVDYLVMELLDGESLATRLERGPLPLEQVLRVGAQVAGALEAAHRRGVVHRDLKPGNVVLTRSGAKLLDFGLAKASDMDPASAETALGTLMRTEDKPLTEEGTILGTFQYMAPEQLEGGAADARTDIFALGALLYEMATGRRAFSGKSRASLIAAILATEPPPISSMQPLTPPALDRLIRGCLAKEPDERWQSAHDVRVQLEAIAEGGPGVVTAAPGARRGAAAGWIAASAVLLLAGIGAVAHWRTAHRPPTPRSFDIAAPPGSRFNIIDAPVVISPDGRHFLVRLIDEHGEHLAMRDVDSFEFRALQDGGYDVFWSPDGRSIAYFDDGKLRRVGVDGGPPRVLATVGDSRGGAWSPDGTTILFVAAANGPVMKVSAEGGPVTPVTRLDAASQQTGHWRPSFLPDGRHFLFTGRNTDPEKSGIYVGSLDGPQTKRVLDGATTAIYAEPGYLLYAAEGDLYAQPFDAARLERRGEPLRVARGVSYAAIYGSPGYSARAGVLAYHPQPAQTSATIVRIDRGSGVQTPLEGSGGTNLDLSRDDTRLAVQRVDAQLKGPDLWVYDWHRGTSTRVTYEPGSEIGPVWSPDGRSLVYVGDRNDAQAILRRPAAGGAEETVWRPTATELTAISVGGFEVDDWSRDGRYLLVELFTMSNSTDIAVIDLAQPGSNPRVVISTPAREGNARFSSDGRWIAYSSNESGRPEVFVQPFPTTGARWQVSTAGGDAPRWRGDGRELFFVASGRVIASVDVDAAGTQLRLGEARRIADTSSIDYVVTGDGKTFLVASAAAPSALPIKVVLDWASGLGK